MTVPIAMLILLAVSGLLLSALALRRLWRRRLLSGGVQGLSGLLLLAVAGLLASLLANLYSYARLSREQPLAELRFQALGPQQYRAYLFVPDSARSTSPRSFLLRGDEWQLDARVLKWQGPAILLGADARYRLERLSGRYRDVDQARHAPYTIYQLSRDPGIDLWALARRHPHWLPWLDAVYGSAAYLPMADGALFSIHVSQSGLVARPLNAPAQQAVSDWH